MEIDETKPFHLLFPGEEALEIPSQVIKYIGVWDSFYQDYGIREFTQPTSQSLSRSMWQEIFKIYLQYDEEGKNSLDTEAVKILASNDLTVSYQVIHVADFYDMPLLLVAMIKAVMRRLLSMNETQLYLAHSNIKRITPTAEPPETILGAILPEYVKHRTILEEIFRVYIRANSLIQMIKQRFLPRVEHLIATGWSFSLVITEQCVLSAGNNEDCQLGRTEKPGEPLGFHCNTSIKQEIISVVASLRFSVFLTRTGKLYTTEPSSDDFSMIDCLSPWKVPLEFVLSVAVGADHIVALTSDGVFVWHTSVDRRTTLVPIPIEVSIVAIATTDATLFLLSETGDLYQTDVDRWLSRDKTKSASLISKVDELPGPVDKVVASQASVFAILRNDSVYGWGANQYGGLGLGDTTRRKKPTRITSLDNRNITKIAAGLYHTLFIGDSGVYIAGRNDRYIMPSAPDPATRTESYLVPTLDTTINTDIIEASAGVSHTLFLKSTGLYGTGRNEYRELGGGKTPLYITKPTLLPVTMGHEKYHFITTTMTTTEPIKRRKIDTTNVSCYLCGSNATPLHLHRPSQKLFCNSKCLNRYK